MSSTTDLIHRAPAPADHVLAHHRARGRRRRLVGWLTGDRRVEAAGEAEYVLCRKPSEKDVDVRETIVRGRYGDGGRLPGPRRS